MLCVAHSPVQMAKVFSNVFFLTVYLLTAYDGDPAEDGTYMCKQSLNAVNNKH